MGKIINQKDEDGDFEISYLKKSVKDPSRFVFPVEPDIAPVGETDITTVLPQSLIAGETERLGVNLHNPNVY
jgi:hypothetical protein